VELIWQKYAEKMFNDAPMMPGIGQFDLIIARFSILFGTLCLENGNQEFGSQALPIQITRLLTSDFGNFGGKNFEIR